MPCLAFNLNDGNEFIFDLVEERLSLGRNPGNEIVLDNNQISSFHAEFTRQPSGVYLLTDLKSSNGTFVNGKRVESAELKSGDRVRFGQLEARFRDMFILRSGREKKGATPSSEEKRRIAESSGGPKIRTDLIPPADKPEGTNAVRAGTANGQPVGLASHTGAAGNPTPKLPAPTTEIFAPPKTPVLQNPAEKPAQSVAPATEAVHKHLAALQAEQDKLEMQIKSSEEEAVRQRNLLESAKRELEETLAVRREQLKEVERGVTELEARRAAAQKQIIEAADAEGRLKSTTEMLQRVVEQKSAAETALTALKTAHEEEQKKLNDTTAGHDGVRKQHEEAKLELARLHDELSATGKQAAGARATATEAERQFADWQAGLQKSQAAKIQEIDAILVAKQSAVEAAEGRLKELETRRAEHEAKTAEQTEGERKLANLRNEISVHESKRTELTGLVTALVKERGAHEAEIVRLAAERARQVTGLTELAAREQDLRTTVGALQNEIETGRKLSARGGKLEQEISQKEGTLRSLEERIAQLVRREEEFTLKLQSLPETDSRLKDATKVLSLIEEQKDALERDVASLSRQREEKEREIAGIAEQGHAQHVLMQTLSKRNAWLEESVATRNRRVEAANRYIAGIDSRAAEIEAKSATHQAELEAAQAGVTRAAAELESLRNEIKAATTLKEKLIAEHDEARSRLHELTKLLIDTAVRRREATEGAGSERML